MPSIPIMCLICSQSIKEDRFPQHMQSVHGTLSQTQAMQQEKNIPTIQSPIILDKEAPPSTEFMEIAKMMDEKPKSQPMPPAELQKGRAAPETQQEEPKPITLEYKYSGQCKDCRNEVETLIVKVKQQTVAVAFCIRHGQLREREVSDLEELIIDTSEALMSTQIYKDFEKRKAGVTNVKHKRKTTN